MSSRIDAAERTGTRPDRRGLVLATVSPTGLAAQSAYDGAGRVAFDYTGTLSAATWAAAGTPSGSVVLHQDDVTDDKDGNVIETLGLDRLSTTSATQAGTLSFLANDEFGHDSFGLSPIGPGQVIIGARPTITDAYFDAAGRPTATVDVGTNGYDGWSRPATPPARGNGPLVTTDAYNAAGEVAAVVDPLGLVTADTYDPLGRTLTTVADYTGTFNPDGTPAGATPTNATNQTTAYTYDGDGHQTSMTAVLPSAQPSQTTDYVYGATTAAGSGVNDDDLLVQTQYPDPSTGQAEGGSGWAFANGAGTAANGSAVSGANPDAPQGSQVGYVQGPGTVGQSVALNGGTYTLTFDAAQRSGYGSESLDVLVDGTVVATLTPGSTNYAAESVTFTVAAGTHAIQFQGVDPDGGDHIVLLDAVALVNDGGGVAPELADGGFETPPGNSGAYGGYGFTYNPPRAASGQAETSTYDALGDATGYTDRDATVHAYTYDAFGRLTSDAVTAFGTGVDQTVKMLGYTYTDDGLLASATSYSSTAGGASNVVNQDADAYDGFGQLASEEQTVAGAASVSSPTVGYTYDAANGDRLSGIVYPNGRTLSYNYNASALTNAASQITSLSDGSGTIQSYTYLGLATPVTFAAGNGVTLSYLAGDGSASDGGDVYTGLDQFGRVVDQDWVNTSGTAVDEQQYAYDADGNVLSRANTVVTSQSETYAYDGLNRLTGFDRGTIDGSGTIASPTTTESWQLDAVGNWQSNTVNSVTTARTNNAQNQVTSVGSATLSYDSNGNTLADGTGQQYVYDAWNRLVTVKSPTGTTLAAYTYDAQGRRVTEAYPGQLTTDLYYSKDWQVLETDVGGTAVQQYTWSPFYVDGLVEWDDHTPGESGTALDRRLYAEQDADYNVTSLTNSSGAVVERYAYDPYGSVTVENADGTTRGTGAVSASLYGQLYLHQGLQVDICTGLYYDRERNYNPSLGRFEEEDPAGYVEGANRSQFVSGNPVTHLDPTGLITKGEVICAGLCFLDPALGIGAIFIYYGATTTTVKPPSLPLPPPPPPPTPRPSWSSEPMPHGGIVLIGPKPKGFPSPDYYADVPIGPRGGGLPPNVYLRVPRWYNHSIQGRYDNGN